MHPRLIELFQKLVDFLAIGLARELPRNFAPISLTPVRHERFICQRA